MFKEYDNLGAPTAHDRDLMLRPSFETSPLNPDKKAEKEEKKKKKNLIEVVIPKEEKSPLDTKKPEIFTQDKDSAIISDKKTEELEHKESDTEEDEDDNEAEESDSENLEENAEKLDTDEARLAAQQFVEVREQEVAEEQATAPPDSPEAAAAAANAVFLEQMQRELEAANSVADIATENAAETTVQQLEEIVGAEDEASSETAPPSVETETLESDVTTDDELETAPSTQKTSSSSPSFSSTTSRASGSTSGPQVGPTLQRGSNNPPPTITDPGSGGGGGGGSSPNIIVPNTPNQAPMLLPEKYDPHSRAGDMLLGGLVGYMLGRRRGRIKTEDRLLPIQEKLETEVKDLHERIAAKELEIRALAVQKVEQQPDPEARQGFTEKLKAKAIARSQRVSHLAEVFTTPEVKKAGAIHNRRQEALGRIVVETADKTPEQVASRVESMVTTDVLAVAAQISVEGVTVRQMYEAGQLNPEGLRRVVTEYLSGGNVERRLASEMLGEEQQHERSVERFRTDSSSSSPAVTGGGGPVQPASITDVTRRRLEEAQHPDSEGMYIPPTAAVNKEESKPPVALITSVVLFALTMVIALTLLLG